MTVAYVISAYKLPGQLIRLVRALQAPGRVFFIHVDRRTADTVYDAMAAGLAVFDNVEFLPRHDCEWGDFGHVRATLKGLNRLAATGRTCDYVSLLTGQDYPIVSNASADERLARADGHSFMNFQPLPVDGLEDGGWARLPARELPYGLVPYFGSGYWTLHRTAVEYVRAFLRDQPARPPT